jgi:hypothetical protein
MLPVLFLSFYVIGQYVGLAEDHQEDRDEHMRDKNG